MSKNNGKNAKEPKKPKRNGVPKTFWMEEELIKAAQTWRKNHPMKPSMKNVVNLALRKFLESQGAIAPTP